MPKYSVIIPTYKRSADMVLRAVNSVMCQTEQNFEILVIDDNKNGSSYSDELKTAFGNMNKIRYIKQDGNRGACAARNMGITQSDSEYLAFLDDDDTWEPQKAELQIAELEKSSDIGMVFCLGHIVNEKTGGISDYYTAKLFRPEVSFEDLLMEDYIGSTSQAMVKKKVFKICGGFMEELPARQDYEMWLRISRNFRIVGVEKFLFTHYIHDGEQISGNPYKALKGYRMVYKKYRDDYKKYPKARVIIFSWMKRAVKGKNYILYGYYRVKVKILRIKLRKSLGQ